MKYPNCHHKNHTKQVLTLPTPSLFTSMLDQFEGWIAKTLSANEGRAVANV